GSGWLGISGLLIAGFLWSEGTKELWRVRLRWSGHPLGNIFGQAPGGAPGAAPGAARAAEPQPAAPRAPRGPADEGPRRPMQWEFELGEHEAPQGARRLDETALRRLEAYRGPLRRPAAETEE
ncbi:MAG: hypothetical protein ACYS26_07590, partial [Planctomycetota bacterium]